MIFGILQNAPVWIWPLLVVLMWVGVQASRDRDVKAWLLYMLPFLGVLAMNAVARLPTGGWVWGAFALAYACGVGAGFVFQKKIVLGKEKGVVRLAGEWVTLLVLMVIFWMNFAAGLAASVGPDVYTSVVFHGVFAGVEGLAAGSFLGRAVRVFVGPNGAGR